MADHIRAASPLLAVEQDTTHGPTRELLAALRENNWRVAGRREGTAVLTHDTYGSLTVSITPGTTDQLSTFIDGRQVPRRLAMLHARGVA